MGVSLIDASRDKTAPASWRSVLAPRMAAVALAFFALAAETAEAQQVGKVSGLPLPRYVSLKSDRVNLREGPSKDHRTTWVFERAGLPVEITAEFDTWRKVRKLGRHGRLGPAFTIVRAPHSSRRTLEEGSGLHALFASGRECHANGKAAVRRHRQREVLRRHLVPHLWRRFRRLSAADRSVGRLSEREDRLSAAPCPAGRPRGPAVKQRPGITAPCRPRAIERDAKSGPRPFAKIPL